MGAYVTAAEIKERLLGKVRFTDSDIDENAVSSGLLAQLIEEAEGEVELRLSVRYEVPFVGDNDEAFSTLPNHTQVQIKSLCRLESCKRILGLDFGRATPNDGSKYLMNLEEEWERRLDRLIEYREEQFGHFKYPPLPSLKLAAHNSETDDGYAGRVLVTSDAPGNYAGVQMSSPGETIWNGVLRDVD
jgi:hypothetical protein